MKALLQAIGFLFMVALLLLLPALWDPGWMEWVIGLAAWGLYYAIIDFIYKYPTKKKDSD